jgi:hypothetical protein
MHPTQRRVVTAAGIGACVLIGLAATNSRGTESKAPAVRHGGDESPGAEAAAEDAYIYGYPLVVLDKTKRVVGGGVTNRLEYLPRPPGPEDKLVVRPNVDTLYTTGFLDLTAEPVVIHVPDTHGRYYVMQMLDAYTNVFAAPGKRTTGTDAHDFAVVGPDWKGDLPGALTRIDSPTNSAWVLSRVQLNGANDVPAVVDLSRQYAVAPLSQWPTNAVAAVQKPPMKTESVPPGRQVDEMSADAFFHQLATLLRANAPPQRDADALARFAGVGLVPGRPFAPPSQVSSILEQAKTRALARIREKSRHMSERMNGWQVTLRNIGAYGTDYDQRAAAAYAGLGANLPADSVYPMTEVDGAGQPLDGDRRYVLHFGRDELPPVNAFWSVTLYDKNGWFVPNTSQRFAARDQQLTKNPDGSTDIYLQASAPDREHRENWLPTPKSGPFNLLLRMYWPKQAVLDGTYAPPSVQQAASP